MNHLGFVVCFIFTTLITISTPEHLSIDDVGKGVHEQGCEDVSASCTFGSQCCSGLCQNVLGDADQMCACKLNGVKCKSNIECCNGNCYNRKCNCKLATRDCAAAGECCSGVCGSVVASTTSEVKLCFCKRKQAECADDAECCTGFCSKKDSEDDGVCSCPATAEKVYCKFNKDCCDGETCNRYYEGVDSWGYCEKLAK